MLFVLVVLGRCALVVGVVWQRRLAVLVVSGLARTVALVALETEGRL